MTYPSSNTSDAELLEALRTEFVQGFLQEMQDTIIGRGLHCITPEEARDVIGKIDREEAQFKNMIVFIGEVLFREPKHKRIVMSNKDLRILQYIAQRNQATIVYTGRKNKNGRTLDNVPIVVDDSAEKPRLE